MSSYSQNYSSVWGSCPLTVTKSSLQMYVFFPKVETCLFLRWVLPIFVIQLDMEFLAFSGEITISKDLTVNIDKPGSHLKNNYGNWEVNRTVVLLCYINRVGQYPTIWTQGLSGQSWLSCMLTDEKMRPALVHNGPMTTSVTLFHIVCTEGRTMRQVFTKGIRIQMCRQLRVANRIPAMKAKGMARNIVRNL